MFAFDGAIAQQGEQTPASAWVSTCPNTCAPLLAVVTLVGEPQINIYAMNIYTGVGVRFRAVGPTPCSMDRSAAHGAPAGGHPCPMLLLFVVCCAALSAAHSTALCQCHLLHGTILKQPLLICTAIVTRGSDDPAACAGKPYSGSAGVGSSGHHPQSGSMLPHSTYCLPLCIAVIAVASHCPRQAQGRGEIGNPWVVCAVEELQCYTIYTMYRYYILCVCRSPSYS